MSHLDTCLNWHSVPSWKNVHFWNMFLTALDMKKKWHGARQQHVFLTHCIWSSPTFLTEKILCGGTASVTYLPALIWQSLHSANLKHVSKWQIFQNGTPCQSETCFRMAHVSERHAIRTIGRIMCEASTCSMIVTLRWRLQEKVNSLYTRSTGTVMTKFHVTEKSNLFPTQHLPLHVCMVLIHSISTGTIVHWHQRLQAHYTWRISCWTWETHHPDQIQTLPKNSSKSLISHSNFQQHNY